MTITFDHTIVVSKDRSVSAAFFRWLFDLPEAPSWGPFTNVQLSDGALIQFAEPPVDEIQPQHYAFRVTDDLFDIVVKRLSNGAIRYWADPHQTQKRQINHHHDGRGVYFKDPAGHLIEVLTKPYLP
ncbi:VOC family protein [Rhodococcus sp. H29-C3]|uniref:VOC family protein n=1 Tax=Rhodococcus sp. H29-C3 TaxID=3046307 RepID=UPI0024B88BC0|nr:VOC family protein [Rhodococcus sp. H29-C3]MDJ0362235.1 VOC family protein [Rhodococcus sp. H29-C3]